MDRGGEKVNTFLYENTSCNATAYAYNYMPEKDLSFLPVRYSPHSMSTIYDVNTVTFHIIF